MNKQKQEELERAFQMLEAGNNLDRILAIFPERKKDIQEINSLVNSLGREKEKINPPKEILEKIFKEKEFFSEKNGRFSAIKILTDLIINYLKSMNQKPKLSIAILGVFAFLIVGIIIFGPLNNGSKIANNSNQEQTTKTEPAIATTSVAIGDQEIDSSINSILNDVLSEDELDAELSDIELALSDIEELDQINNLFDDNEL